MSADIRVIGLGNVLMADDAFGPYVIHELTSSYEFPSNVSVADVGTPGLDLTPYVMHARKLVVVDTVRSEGPAGSIRLYRKGDILKHAPLPRLGPHDPGLKETLLALDFDDSGPDEVLLIGVIPERIAASTGLSPRVHAAVGQASLEVLLELARLGLTVKSRPNRTTEPPWWERPATDGIPAPSV